MIPSPTVNDPIPTVDKVPKANVYIMLFAQSPLSYQYTGATAVIWTRCGFEISR